MTIKLGSVNLIGLQDGTTNLIPVVSDATIYTVSFAVGHSEKFGLHAKAASGGTIDLLVQLEVGMVRPTTEEAVDTTNWSVPNGFSDIVNLVNNTLWMKELSFPPFPFIRFKVVGQGTNAATTTILLKLFNQGK